MITTIITAFLVVKFVFVRKNLGTTVTTCDNPCPMFDELVFNDVHRFLSLYRGVFTDK
jgi:hypothetical protein